MATLLQHGSCVAYRGKALLIIGASGSGKSGLALQLMAYGAQLVADDQVLLERVQDTLIASAPAAIQGLIEARGVGILKGQPCARATVCAIVNMDVVESERLPPKRFMDVLSLDIPLFHKVQSPVFAPALLQYLKDGALDPDEHP